MRRIPLERKIKDTYGNKCICCAMCGDAIFLEDQRRWQPNDGDESESIAGICFMTVGGDPVEAFDLCDACIGKMYSKMIY